MTGTIRRNGRTARRHRQGAALMACIFIVAVVTVMVVSIMETEMIQIMALRNTRDYDRALYLAGAGAHHCMAELEQDISWRTGIPTTELPAGSVYVYEATIVDGAAGDILVTATGTAGSISRRVEVTIRSGS